MHVCPLQLDVVERLVRRYSNEGETVYDPFGGLMTGPVVAVQMGRSGRGCELNAGYFRDGVGYLEEAEAKRAAPPLFAFLAEKEG
jgi:DNA modification methylase